MRTFVINSEEDKELVITALRATDEKLKVYIQPLYPKATPNQYKYLFGVVYARIAEYIGGVSVWDVHKDHMLFFNVEYAPLGDMWEFRRKGGDEFDRISIAIYIEKVRSFWINDIYIEDAHEIFVT